ncbi:MAG: hypothetical protein KGY68_06445, partial [Candidatus Thermoplasmatota archaeon]|nr:hypothetical protein [Candidatus Thermoplasmatota archaeon]
MVKDKYSNPGVNSSDIDMKMGKIFLAIGILLIAGGLVSAFFGVQGLTGSIQNPSNVAIKSLSFDGEGFESKTVELDAGSYDVW